MSEINPVEFGKLLQAVETLTIAVEKLNTEMESMKRGKFILYGMLIAAAGAGGTISAVLTGWLKS